MSDFLLELRSEEIPARMQAGARADLEKLFRKAMGDAGVALGEITVWSTPRRLALIARGLPDATAAVSEEMKGPRVGAPPQALEGFLRKTGLAETDLVERDGVLFAMIERAGRATVDVLAEAIPALIRAFPWPKSQRWGAASISTESLRWVRPLSAIVALLGRDVVPFEIDGIAAGRLTRGHRFHSHGEIEIADAEDYSAKLRAAHVIVNHQTREALIREQAKAAAAAAGLTLVEDEGLVIENAGLTEWPVPLLGRFDAAYLDVPPEVIQLTARTNQKYFVCNDAAGKLANAFVCTANIVANDGGAEIVAGNRKVLAARLSDARFFWEQDRKVPLAKQAEKLSRITFHEKLGTVADKVERVAKLAEWLASEGIVPNCDPALARQAAELCKADLVTEMVGEFPELQGLMGGYYARAEGVGGEHKDAVADAIRDHYKPVGQGDDVPTAPVTVAVSLADKLDTLISFFAHDMAPTGSKDPFALRRASLGVIAILITANTRLGLNTVIRHWRKQFSGTAERTASRHDLLDFFADRLKVQQREAGVRHDLIDAVFALGGEDDLVRLLARVHALQAFVGTEDGTNLLAGYKRAANILKKEGFEPSPRHPGLDPGSRLEAGAGAGSGTPGQARGDEVGGEQITLSYTPEPAEKALIDALDAAGPKAAAAVAAEGFAGAMAALASLRAPIDAFFDEVTVNDADPAKRLYRLSLLARLRDAVHGVADFSRIEG
ncbi:MAG: glycine--tRNA ligase subunit beta [Novosphingobium sp.]